MSAFLKTFIFKLTESTFKGTNQYRCYARFSHRQPRKVFTPEEYAKLTQTENYEQNAPKTSQHKHFEADDKYFSEPDIIDLNSKNFNMEELSREPRKWRSKDLKVPPKIIKPEGDKKETKKAKYIIKPIKKTYDMLDTVIGEDGQLVYTKMENDDPYIGKLLSTIQSSTKQRKNELTVLEGKRLIKDALKAKCSLQTLIFSQKPDVEELQPYLPKSGAKLMKIPYKELKKYSNLTTSPGIIAVIKTPDVSDYVPKDSIPLTVICDNIREPGNLGAILRTAAGVGAEKIILTKGCVHLWEPKVLRSASGCHFSLNIHQKVEWSFINETLGVINSAVFVADNKVVQDSDNLITSDEFVNDNSEDVGKNLPNVASSLPLFPYYSCDFTKPKSIILIIGGETEGISKESYLFADKLKGCRLNIPLGNGIDSLNTGTALGVIAFEIKRQIEGFKNMNMEMCIKQ